MASAVRRQRPRPLHCRARIRGLVERLPETSVKARRRQLRLGRVPAESRPARARGGGYRSAQIRAER